jgi:hypothetical protein
MPVSKSVLKAVAVLETIEREGHKPLREIIKANTSRKSGDWRRQYPPNQWHAELVGIVKGYPISPEVWAERKRKAKENFAKQIAEKGMITRAGVPDGFKGLRQCVDDARLWRSLESKRIVKHMEDNDLIEYPDASQYEGVEDHDAAKGALAYCVSVVRSDTYKPRERLEAARTVLNFTKAKPVQRVENTLKSAEDFLDAIAGKITMPTE